MDMDMDMVDMAIPLGSGFCATISAHALYPHGYSPHADKSSLTAQIY